VNTLNNKIYIGSAVNILKRFTQHRHLLNNNKHFNIHLQSSWNNYGENSFIFEIIEECTLDDLYLKEEYFIKKYNTINNKFGYNKRVDCKTNLGIKLSNETREKLRISHLGHKRSIETHKKILKSQHKSIIQFDNEFNVVDVYESIKIAAEINQFCKQSISLCATKKMKSHPRNEFYWCFKSEFTDIDDFKKQIIKHKEMKTLLFIDDYRDPFDTEVDWLVFSPIGKNVVIHWVKSYTEFINWILSNGIPDGICFDHDLGKENEPPPKNYKNSVVIHQFNKKNEYINTFFSITNASKYLKLSIGNISKCINAERKTAGGFILKYDNDDIIELLNTNEEKNGFDCAKFLVDYCMTHDLDIPPYGIQSANPVGKKNIDMYLKNYIKFRKENE